MTQPTEDEEFLQGLQDEDPKMRKLRALQLKSWTDSRSANLLKTALAADANPEVRAVAALSLCYRGAEGREAGMFEPLAGALSDEAPEVRAKAANWLGRLKDSRAFELLMGAVTDKHSIVREAAVRSLGSLGDARAVQTLLDALSDPDEFVRDKANQALIELGDPEPEMRLSIAISSNGRGLRLAAALDLANRHDRRALAPLADVLTQSWDGMKYDHKACKSAIEGLLKFRDADAVPALLFAVGDDDFEVKVAANQALIELGDPQPFDRLSRVIEFRHVDEEAELRQSYDRVEYQVFNHEARAKRWIAEDRELRCEAIKALGKLGDPRGIRLFLEALDSRNEEMRKAANQALIELGDPEPYERLAERGGEQAIEILSRALTNHDPEVQLQAASALITLSDAPKFDALVILLYDGDESQRKEAAEALGKLGDARAHPLLLDALSDEDEDVRYAANDALLELGDSDPEKRASTRRKKEWCAAVETLEDWKASGELESIYAVRMLCESGDPDASSILEGIVEECSSDDLAYEIIIALGKLAVPSTIRTLMGILVEEETWSGLREAAEQAVIDIVSKERESGLSYLLEELELWWPPRLIAAARLLGELGDESVVEGLKGLTEEENINVRAAARRALRKLGSRGISVGTVTEPTSGNRIEFAGVIASIDIPEGWRETWSDLDFAQTFSSPDDPEVQVTVVRKPRGKLPSSVETNLTACLSHEHVLNPRELHGINTGTGMEYLTDPKSFRFCSAGVEEINGRKVICVKVFRATLPCTINVYLVRSPSDAWPIEEIWCEAPTALWSQYEPLFATVTRSIEWKSAS